MSVVLWKALALASGGLFSFGAVLLVVILLGSENGLRKATAFFTGYFGSYLLIGAVVLWIGGQLGTSQDTGGKPWITGILSLLVGCLLLYFAQKKIRTPATDNDEPPKFLTQLDAMQAKKLLAFGALIPVLNFKNLAIYLSAISILIAGKLSIHEGLIAVVAVDVVFCTTVLLPILFFLIFSSQALKGLLRIRQWLEKNNRPVAITMMLLFGTIFVTRGVIVFL